MAADNFPVCLREVLKHEGGYVDHPRDPGGATNLGVTIGTLSAWLGRPATKAEVKALTVEQVSPIYRKNYWDKMGCDALPKGVDFAVFDPAVNSGPGRARQWYQAGRRSDPVETIRAICDARMSFLRRLGTFSTFGKGWTRRVAEVRAKAEVMARAGSPTIQIELNREAKRASDAAAKANKQAPALAVATTPVASVPVVTGADPAVWLVIGLTVLALGFLAFMAWHRAQTQSVIAEAYSAESKEATP